MCIRDRSGTAANGGLLLNPAGGIGLSSGEVVSIGGRLSCGAGSADGGVLSADVDIASIEEEANKLSIADVFDAGDGAPLADIS